MGAEDSADATPQQLTETYHKARRSLVLCSGLLIAWEYLGLKLGEAVDTPAGPLTLANPEAAPVVLLLLVLFFALRLAIEWKQCDEARRKRPASRVDLAVSCMLGGAAVLLFVAQQALGIRLADVLTPVAAGTFTAGFFVVILVRLTMVGSRLPNQLAPGFRVVLCCIVGVATGVALFYSQDPETLETLNVGWDIFLVSYFGGLGLATFVLLWYEANEHDGFGNLWRGSNGGPP